jgi:hydrogenase maturation protease
MRQSISGNLTGRPATLPAGLFCEPAAAPALVLGIGNLLLGDEGAGIRAVEELAARYALPPEVEAIDGGTMGLELLPYLAGRKLLILVDAVRTGAPPGTVVQMELADSSGFFREKISPHQIGMAEVLSVAAFTGDLPGRIVLIGVVPKEMATGLALSPEIASKIVVMADMVAAELTAAGFPLARRDPAAE